VTELSQRAEGQAENPHPAVRVTGGKIAIAHIPIPGTNGLFVELRPRGHAASTGPASTLYVRDLTRGQQLRLDFSYQPADRRLQYHWSPYGSLDDLTADDASAHKRGEPGAYSAAKQYRCAGRDLILLGLPVDAYRIVIARPWWRQATREVAGWLGTWSVFDATEVWGPPPPRPGKPGVETLIPDTQAGASQGPVGAAWSPGEAYDWVEEIALEAVPEIVLSAMPAPSDRR
jgi:hypothetical protein